MTDNVVTLDVRAQIAFGREPFGTIMQAVSRLKEGQRLLLLAPFEPAPLYSVMEQRGFVHQATPLESGDWEILFTPDGQTAEFEGPRPSCERAADLQ